MNSLSSMNILLFFLCYLLFHLGFYILIARNIPYFMSEIGIFLFHFVSFLFSSLGCISIALLMEVENIIVIVFAVIAAHGIYSLTFLELWSLAQGGFSLQVLRSCPIPTTDSTTLIGLEVIGNVKFSDRLSSIQNIGLVKQTSDKLGLTYIGMIVTRVLLAFCKITNIKDRG